MVLANVDGKSLTDPAFAPIWAAIDARRCRCSCIRRRRRAWRQMDMTRFQLTASLGFTFDTTLAVARMIYDGFFDRYPRLKIIAAHGGGALPYLIARMDQCFDNIPACQEKIEGAADRLPVAHLRRRGRVLARRARPVREDLRRRQRACTAPTIRTRSATCRAASPGSTRSPAALRDKVRGRNAQRIFGF